MTGPLERAIEVIVRVAQPDRVILFGSRALGSAGAAGDYDLLILKEGVENKRALAQEIYLNFDNIGAPVDIIVADLEQYELKKDDPYLIYSEVAKSGKVVYEKPDVNQ